MCSYGLLGFGGKAQVYGQRYMEYGNLTVYSVCQRLAMPVWDYLVQCFKSE